MAGDPENANGLLDRIQDLADRNNRVSLGDIAESLGSRGHAPFLVIPALIDISPLGGIPGLPTALAMVMALVAGQLLFGREHLWLPGVIARLSIPAGKAHAAVNKARGVAGWLDRWFHDRLPALSHGPFVRLAAGICILLTLTVPPLELLPFATTAPMAAIAIFGIALLVRDGMLMLAAILLSAAAIGLGVGLIPWEGRGK